ncbi:exodeoxyribonuclease VII large subunit, putative [Babesia ovata]|uniref:Exodeoxyribonuclease VII large subunit, putative n=1 Tax=Babesia ovata TaxID=189622 RepID=A0A2H6KIU0_9APIC|nr:exodeoxyribonuclease VII large subunit, putative [Babesia ovata]GBE62899.1 exodeoxyribonuclease VII large subunit, putative [Babesia ovata]
MLSSPFFPFTKVFTSANFLSTAWAVPSAGSGGLPVLVASFGVKLVDKCVTSAYDGSEIVDNFPIYNFCNLLLRFRDLAVKLRHNVVLHLNFKISFIPPNGTKIAIIRTNPSRHGFHALTLVISTHTQNALKPSAYSSIKPGIATTTFNERVSKRLHFRNNSIQTFLVSFTPLNFPNLFFYMLENLFNTIQLATIRKLPAKRLNRRVNFTDRSLKLTLDVRLKMPFKIVHHDPPRDLERRQSAAEVDGQGGKQGATQGRKYIVERGGEPECECSVEEGGTDAIEELGDGVVGQPVERVHLLDSDLEGHAEIVAGPLGLVAAGGSGEAVDVFEHEAVLEECGRGGVAVHDGGAVGSVIGARGQWPSLGCAVIVAAPGVAVGCGVGAVPLAVLEQCTEEVVESLRQVHYPREVEVGVFPGEGGAYVVAEGLECDAPLPEARVADGVIEGLPPVLAAAAPLTYEVVVKGEQLVWRPWRAGEEAFQVAAQPGEGG